MEPYQLEYFLALYKCRQFSQASELLNVSQPALSHGIKKLEQKLGIELFIRNNRAIQLTSAGEEFAGYARRILSEMENAQNAMSGYAQLNKGNIRIGAVPAIPYLGIIPLIASFQRAYPGINIEISEETNSVLLKKLNSAEIDIAFINYCSSIENLDIYQLLHDQMVFLVARTHWLANMTSINLSELSNENFLLEAGQKNDFVKCCSISGFEPNITLLSIQALTLKESVEQGLGIAPLSAHIAASLLNSQTVIVNFTPVISRTAALAIDKTNNNFAARIFKEFILAEASKGFGK